MRVPPPQMPQYQYAESTGGDRRGRANTARCRADTAPRKLTAQQIFARSPADSALQLARQRTQQRRASKQLGAGCCSSHSLLGAGRAGPCAHRGTCSTLGNVVLLRHLCSCSWARPGCAQTAGAGAFSRVLWALCSEQVPSGLSLFFLIRARGPRFGVCSAQRASWACWHRGRAEGTGDLHGCAGREQSGVEVERHSYQCW